MVSGFGAGEVILDHCNLHLCNPEIWGMVVSFSQPSLSAGGQTGVWSLVWPLSTDHAAHAAGGQRTSAVLQCSLDITCEMWCLIWPIVTLMDGEL